MSKSSEKFQDLMLVREYEKKLSSNSVYMYGKLILKKSGTVLYEGDFIDGKFDGYGIMNQGTYQYRGEFVKDKFHGLGSILMNGIVRYTGYFENGQYRGEGTEFTATGSIKEYVEIE